jgi:hypothetical protein
MTRSLEPDSLDESSLNASRIAAVYETHESMSQSQMFGDDDEEFD